MNTLPPELKLRLLEVTAQTTDAQTLVALGSVDHSFRAFYSNQKTHHNLIRILATNLIPARLYELCWATNLLPQLQWIAPDEAEKTNSCHCCDGRSEGTTLRRGKVERTLIANNAAMPKFEYYKHSSLFEKDGRTLKEMMRLQTMINTLYRAQQAFAVERGATYEYDPKTLFVPLPHDEETTLSIFHIYAGILNACTYIGSTIRVSDLDFDPIFTRAYPDLWPELGHWQHYDRLYEETIDKIQTLIENLIDCWDGTASEWPFPNKLKNLGVEMGLVSRQEADEHEKKGSDIINNPGFFYLGNVSTEDLFRMCTEGSTARFRRYCKLAFADDCHVRYVWSEGEVEREVRADEERRKERERREAVDRRRVEEGLWGGIVVEL